MPASPSLTHYQCPSVVEILLLGLGCARHPPLSVIHAGDFELLADEFFDQRNVRLQVIGREAGDEFATGQSAIGDEITPPQTTPQTR